MPRSELTLADRARGALLGHAAGSVLGLPTESLQTADAIAARFPGAVRDVIRQDTPESPYHADIALALLLAEELLQPQVDLQRLVRRWMAWLERDGRGVGTGTATALRYIAAHHTPPPSTGGVAGNGVLSRCLPVALATLNSPANLVSGSYHTALLTHPDERCGWGAVAINVAAARLLLGKRDFIPDVIEALRNNRAPEELLSAVRRVPLERKGDLPVVGPLAGYVVHGVEIALWFAHHEHHLERGLLWLANAGGDTATNAAVAGGLMGAREGEAAVPERWLGAIPGVERIRTLA